MKAAELKTKAAFFPPQWASTSAIMCIFFLLQGAMENTFYQERTSLFFAYFSRARHASAASQHPSQQNLISKTNNGNPQMNIEIYL